MAFPFWWGSQNEPANKAEQTSNPFTYIQLPYDDSGGFGDGPGYIDTIEFFVETTETNCKFGVFSKAVAVFTPEHIITGIDLDLGLNTLVEGIDFALDALPIVAGEYAGFYLDTTGDLDRDGSGGTGYWSYSGDGTGGAQTYSESVSTREIQFRVQIRAPAAGGIVVLRRRRM